jgi:hypothetical protein
LNGQAVKLINPTMQPEDRIAVNANACKSTLIDGISFQSNGQSPAPKLSQATTPVVNPITISVFMMVAPKASNWGQVALLSSKSNWDRLLYCRTPIVEQLSPAVPALRRSFLYAPIARPNAIRFP